MPALVLASTSASRRKMLTDAGIRVICEPPGVDERGVRGDDPVALATALALAKAAAVAARRPGDWVLGADQVVFEGGEISGKPSDAEDHARRLLAMRGRTHDLVTGFALVAPGVREVGHEITRLSVRADLGEDEIRAYVATGEGSGCAGGYAVEGHGGWLFSRIEGDFFNVLGLPLLSVLTALRRHGWRYQGSP